MNSRKQIGLWFLLLRISLLLYVCETQVVSRSDADHNIIRLISLFDPSVTFFKAQKARWSKKDLLFRDNSEVLSRKRTYEHRLEGTVNSEDHSLTMNRTSGYTEGAQLITMNESVVWARLPSENEDLAGSNGSAPSTEMDPVLHNFYATYPVERWKAYGLFDESYLNHINKFWLTFEPASTSSHQTMAVLYIIIMTVGCSGNFLVIVMFICCRSLRTPANYLIVNLAVSDFGMLVKMPVFIINSFYEGPVLGTIGCQIYGFLGGLTGTCSIMTLTAIAVDRYYVIVHPLCPQKRTTHARAILMIMAVWFYSAFFSSMPLIGINEYVSEGYLTSCSFDYLRTDLKSRVFIFIFFLAAWLLPLTLISFSYIAIYRVVLKAEKMDFFNGANTRESFKYKKIQDKLKKEVKIAILTTFIVFVWILAWTPYAIVALLGISGYQHLLTPFISTLPALFCKLSSCVNPFMYSINHPRFQKELRLKIGSWCQFKVTTVVRRSSAHSISFDVSLSEANSEFNTVVPKLDHVEHEEGRSVGHDSFNMTVRNDGSSMRRNKYDPVTKYYAESKFRTPTQGKESEGAIKFGQGRHRRTNKVDAKRTCSDSDIRVTSSMRLSTVSGHHCGVCKRSRSLIYPKKVQWSSS